MVGIQTLPVLHAVSESNFVVLHHRVGGLEGPHAGIVAGVLIARIVHQVAFHKGTFGIAYGDPITTAVANDVVANHHIGRRIPVQRGARTVLQRLVRPGRAHQLDAGAVHFFDTVLGDQDVVVLGGNAAQRTVLDRTSGIEEDTAVPLHGDIAVDVVDVEVLQGDVVNHPEVFGFDPHRPQLLGAVVRGVKSEGCFVSGVLVGDFQPFDDQVFLVVGLHHVGHSAFTGEDGACPFPVGTHPDGCLGTAGAGELQVRGFTAEFGAAAQQDGIARTKDFIFLWQGAARGFGAVAGARVITVNGVNVQGARGMWRGHEVRFELQLTTGVHLGLVGAVGDFLTVHGHFFESVAALGNRRELQFFTGCDQVFFHVQGAALEVGVEFSVAVHLGGDGEGFGGTGDLQIVDSHRRPGS